MPAPAERPLDVLVLQGDPVPVAGLLVHLRDQGVAVDTVHDLAAARASFFGAGGHDCLVIAPDVRPGLAAQVAVSLRKVDPSLPMATFGPDLRSHVRIGRTAVLNGYHPGSRAGQGALLRFLRSL